MLRLPVGRGAFQQLVLHETGLGLEQAMGCAHAVQEFVARRPGCRRKRMVTMVSCLVFSLVGRRDIRQGPCYAPAADSVVAAVW